MTFYIQEDKQGIIRDIITFPHEGYRPISYDYALPIGVNGGWYSFDGKEFVEHPELKPTLETDERMGELEKQNVLLRGCIMELASEVYGGEQ